MVAHFTMRTHGVNQSFRFVEGFWLHRKSRTKSDFFRKRSILHNNCAICSKLPYFINTMVDPDSGFEKDRIRIKFWKLEFGEGFSLHKLHTFINFVNIVDQTSLICMNCYKLPKNYLLLLLCILYYVLLKLLIIYVMLYLIKRKNKRNAEKTIY